MATRSNPKKSTKKITKKTTDVAAGAPIVDVHSVAVPPSDVIVAPMAPPARTLSRAAFEQRVRNEAYLLSQRRSGTQGSPFEDWIQAEGTVRGQLSAEGVVLESDTLRPNPSA
jgi:hypothetical protein